MGNKYASMHIKTANSVQIVRSILALYDKPTDKYDKMFEQLERLNARQELFEFIARQKRLEQLGQGEILIVITDGWVSFYNRSLSFEEIAKKARALAKKISEPIVYVSNFDGDVFVFGLIVEGKTKTSGRVCPAPEFYEVTTKPASMSAIYRALDVPLPSGRPQMPTDIMELEELLGSILQVPLSVSDEEDLEYLADEYELLEETNGIPVYRAKYKK